MAQEGINLVYCLRWLTLQVVDLTVFLVRLFHCHCRLENWWTAKFLDFESCGTDHVLQ
jgi:hypothetical protein